MARARSAPTNAALQAGAELQATNGRGYTLAPAPTIAMKPLSPSRANGSNLRLAADIGGTFTDIAVFDDRSGQLRFGKTLSTPQRLVEGINAGVAKAGSDYKSAGLF